MFCKMCLNSHLSASTRSTADMLTFGQELRQPLDLAGGMGPEAPATTSVAAMFNGKPRAGNSREFPVSRETGGKFSGLGNSRVTGISRFPGIPVSREFPVKNARAADRNVHSCQLRVILSCVPVVQWQLRAFETTQTCTHEHVLGGQGCELCVCIECVAVA